MADRSDDFILACDVDGGGGVKRTLSLTQHHDLVTSQWADFRAAAAVSLSNWLSWLQTNDNDTYTWINGMSSARQEGMRQAVLKGA